MALTEILVDWETWNFRVRVVIGPHRYLRACIKKHHRRVYRMKQDAAVGSFFSHHCRPSIIWLEKKPTTPKAIGTLVHEMGHAIMEMHREKGVPLDPENDEAFCYAIGHGVAKVMEGCK